MMRGWPLRLRVMASFGLVQLVVAAALAIGTWQVCGAYVTAEAEASAVAQAKVNARLVETVRQRGSVGLGELLTGLSTDAGSAVLWREAGGQWTSGGAALEPGRLPADLVDSGPRRIEVDGVSALAVAVPLGEALYVEVFPLRELERTLSVVGWLLLAGIGLSGLLAAVIGKWVARRSLRPLTALTSVAARAAAGDLRVRLPAGQDPDLARLAELFNDTAERLQQRVAADERFAGDVSHELRTPVTTMLNAVSVLRRRQAGMEPTAATAVQLLDAELLRFRQMVSDLLEISRDDRIDQALDMEPVRLADLVRAAAGPRRIEVSGDAVVQGDRRRLERAVANLINNADFHGGGVVRLGVVNGDSVARIEVDDAGPGVAAAERERIFERFARGPRSMRDGTGTGLGLSLAAGHIHRHHGRIWVEDRPGGGGARFVIELPRGG
ncbi:sensor histidine kinase [Pseudonocardiaceae bacterium YIM PH 21723]|nr:sensor histidine kinase [Pseudonocardiaceae bacterium YIM PH 21723]